MEEDYYDGIYTQKIFPDTRGRFRLSELEQEAAIITGTEWLNEDTINQLHQLYSPLPSAVLWFYLQKLDESGSLRGVFQPFRFANSDVISMLMTEFKAKAPQELNGKRVNHFVKRFEHYDKSYGFSR